MGGYKATAGVLAVDQSLIPSERWYNDVLLVYRMGSPTWLVTNESRGNVSDAFGRRRGYSLHIFMSSRACHSDEHELRSMLENLCYKQIGGCM